MYARIAGSGIALPFKIMPSAALREVYGFKRPGTVEQMTGIRSRRYCTGDEDALSLLCDASVNALRSTGSVVDDLIVVYDHNLRKAGLVDELETEVERRFPHALRSDGYRGELAFCSGLVEGVQQIRTRIEEKESSGGVVAAFSYASDYLTYLKEARTTEILWGDAGGALVVVPSDEEGIIGYHSCSIPDSEGVFTVKHTEDEKTYLGMDGEAVMSHVLETAPQVISQVLDENGYVLDDLDLSIFHQMNGPGLETLRDEMGISVEKFYINIGEHGNTVGATIPLAWDDAMREGRMKRGSLVMLSGFGHQRGPDGEDLGMDMNAMLLRV